MSQRSVTRFPPGSQASWVRDPRPAWAAEAFAVVVEAWKKGFRAGEVFSKHCPYTRETPEARSWFDGWNEGSAKSLGFPHQTYADRFGSRLLSDTAAVPQQGPV
ncbi:hypothetical protein [Azohydromonas caseinilytica]|uniref:Uncharacterized protein n=1 Tax=Azohydromonas caseinilytica TaxID=2728836 RepID=A0A848FCL5_9BURK|nr:hypothetical protein [Azohydromonas caseinilytica]NML16515.1 hypothetical protein [Azohydromonas caseinilytica]